MSHSNVKVYVLQQLGSPGLKQEKKERKMPWVRKTDPHQSEQLKAKPKHEKLTWLSQISCHLLHAAHPNAPR